MKIVVNACYGGFSLSKAAIAYCGITEDEVYNMPRDNSRLVEFIEKYGSKDASGDCAQLGVVEIPDGVEWYIEEYDGFEHVAEKHRKWYAYSKGSFELDSDDEDNAQS